MPSDFEKVPEEGNTDEDNSARRECPLDRRREEGQILEIRNANSSFQNILTTGINFVATSFKIIYTTVFPFFLHHPSDRETHTSQQEGRKRSKRKENASPIFSSHCPAG